MAWLLSFPWWDRVSWNWERNRGCFLIDEEQTMFSTDLGTLDNIIRSL